MLLFIKSIILKKSRGDKMEKKETRGAKKGRPKPAGSGRKATGLIRKEAITIKFTEEEKEFVNKELRKIAPTKTEAMLKLLKYKSLVD
jgi:homeobox protein chox-7